MTGVEVTINCNAINCLFTDGETIWLGTETGGINLLSPKRLQTELWTCGTSVTETDTPTPVNAVGEDKDGNLWIGLVERGLMKWNQEEKLPIVIDRRLGNGLENQEILMWLHRMKTEKHLRHTATGKNP